MIPSRIRTTILIVLPCFLTPFARAERPEPIGLGDLPAYLAALESDRNASARPIGFRELWETPRAVEGKRVSIEGRLLTRFHAAASGRLPARAELWIDTGSNNLVCLVHPEPDRPADFSPKIGARVRFAGTFLRQISYQGGDVARLAPLIVGPKVAESIEPGERSSNPTEKRPIAWDWAVGLAVGGFVLFVIVGRGLDHRRSTDAETDSIEGFPEPPAFLDDAGDPSSAPRAERSDRE